MSKNSSRSAGALVRTLVTAACWVALGNPVGAAPATQSSPIALSATRLINVNPDANTVSLFNITVNPPAKLAEIAVGTEPVSVAIAGNKAYVANAASGTVSV